MWIDNASDIDMLSYKPFAELLYRIVDNKRMNPLTIGLYGSWGAGKSTILKLTEKIIDEKKSDSGKKIICVNINSWMFEGYDDAKCALMESLLRNIEDNKTFEKESKIKTKIKELFKRVDYLRLGAAAIKKGLPLAISVASGNPTPFLFNLSADVFEKIKNQDGIQDIYDGLDEISKKYLKQGEDEDSSIVKNIRMFKEEFENLLKEGNIDNLVVMIDDLDRCTPDKIIDTLEAIKLFLSVPRTTFIIAVDERVVKYSIKKRYPAIDEDSIDISKDYIEKIIQLPVNIPELSDIDIMNYMLLLTNELYLDKRVLNKLIDDLYKEGIFYTGEKLTCNKVFEMINIDAIDEDKVKKKEEYKRLSDIVEKSSRTVSGVLKGNPRQAKRFLNTFLVRKNMAEIYYGSSNDIEIEILAKLLCLEYIDIYLFRKLNEWHNKSDSGEIIELKELYELVSNDDEIPVKYSLWNNERIINWIKSEPVEIYDKDLSKYLYLCRESLAGEINSIENLTKEEKEILKQITKASKGKEREEILKLKNINKESSNKIIRVLIEMFKEKRGRLLNIGIIYKNFDEWRYEILEYIKSYNKNDFNMEIMICLEMIYKADPNAMDNIISIWKEKKIISEQQINIIRGKK